METLDRRNAGGLRRGAPGDLGERYHECMPGIRIVFLIACSVLLGACKHAPPARQYAMHGEVVALNTQEHTALIKHEKIGDWMEAMTMEYPIKSQSDWSKLAAGERIDATVFVTGDRYYVGDVRVIEKSSSPPANH